MKKYFLHDGTEQQGPFDFEELKVRGVKADTPVWYEGLGEWTTIGSIEELKEHFPISTPPPFVNQKKTEPNLVEIPAKKNTIGKTSLKIAAVLVIIVVAYAVLNKVDSDDFKDKGYEGKTYEEKVMSVEETERSEPTNFLSAEGTYKKTFLGDEFKVDFIITNNATVATYKDAVVRVTYYSKTKTVLESNDYTIYETFSPHSTITKRLRIENYPNVTTIGLEVIKAEAL